MTAAAWISGSYEAREQELRKSRRGKDRLRHPKGKDSRATSPTRKPDLGKLPLVVCSGLESRNCEHLSLRDSNTEANLERDVREREVGSGLLSGGTRAEPATLEYRVKEKVPTRRRTTTPQFQLKRRRKQRKSPVLLLLSGAAWLLGEKHWCCHSARVSLKYAFTPETYPAYEITDRKLTHDTLILDSAIAEKVLNRWSNRWKEKTEAPWSTGWEWVWNKWQRVGSRGYVKI